MSRRLIAPGALASVLLIGTAYGATPDAKPVTIDFNGLQGANGSSFATYSEHGFRVTASKTSHWLNGQDFGDPAPFIYFMTANDSPVSASIYITHGGALFNLTSVAVYSSVTPIPYMFRGIRHGMTVFSVKGTVPNTMGNFATATNTKSAIAIDKLEVTLTDPANAFNNPMGLDNILLMY